MREVAQQELVETLASYVPGLVVRRLAADPAPLAEPAAERSAAAVFFADITGFTALGELLAQRGLAGSEDLAHLLNDYFGRLIALIHAHGGEVTKFAGDALLALWPISELVARGGRGARDALAEGTLRAVQCGLAVQEALHGYVTAEGIPLSLQIGLGAGDVYSVHLGGVFGRWEFLLSGDPLVQMSLAKERAQPGQVVVSPDAWGLIHDHCAGRPLAGHYVAVESVSPPLPVQPLALPALPPEARRGLRAYIPAAVLSRLEAGHGDWVSELRRITVIFVKLPSYGTSIKHPYARTLPKAQAVMHALQSALYRYAGSINKLNVDDKGITLVAALGLPPLAHRDDAARAVHAALEMQQALLRLGRRSAIGITTGWVFCGPVGNELRREYTVVGNVVNMAARLMQAAEARMTARQELSELFCDEATTQAVQEQALQGQVLAGDLAFETLPRIEVKGKSEPVAVFRPRQQSLPRWGTASHPGVLVGRAAELAALAEILQQVRQSPEEGGAVLLVEGEAGIGKTVLVKNLLAQARTRNMTAFSGAGHPLEQHTPYYAWRPVFQQLFGLESLFGDAAAQRSHVLSRLPTLPGERGFPALALRLSPLLNAVLPLGFPENELTGRMPADVRQRTTRLFLLRLLQKAVLTSHGRSGPLRLLVLENSQWLDDASWELAWVVSQQVRPLVLAIVTRPLREQAVVAPLPKACRRLVNAAGVHHLHLGPLSAEEMAALVCEQLSVGQLPAELAGLLQQRTGGHPFLAREFARAWCESGLLHVNGAQAHLAAGLAALEELPAPEVIQKAITGRLDGLNPAYQLVLKTASVVGSIFTSQALATIYPVAAERDRLPDHLETLAQLGFLRQETAGPEPAYTFKYAAIREVAHNLLLYDQRRRLHQALLHSTHP